MPISGNFLVSVDVDVEGEDEDLILKIPFWGFNLGKRVSENRKERGDLIELEWVHYYITKL